MVFMDVCICFRGRSHGGCGVLVVAHGDFCGGIFELGWKNNLYKFIFWYVFYVEEGVIPL